MYERILIAYATATGSTVDVAATIGKTLDKNGFAVDVQPIQDISSVQGYATVIVGSAVQYGTWLPEAVAFVKDHQQALSRVPVAVFCVHIQNQGNDAASRKNRLAYLHAARVYVQPIDEAFFAGRFNRDGAVRLLPRWVAPFVPTLDFRNWDRIRAWANNLSPKLRQM